MLIWCIVCLKIKGIFIFDAMKDHNFSLYIAFLIAKTSLQFFKTLMRRAFFVDVLSAMKDWVY